MPRFSRSKRLGRRRVLQQHPSDVSGRHSIPLFFDLAPDLCGGLSCAPVLTNHLHFLSFSHPTRFHLTLFSLALQLVGSFPFCSLARREEEELICFLRFPTSRLFREFCFVTRFQLRLYQKNGQENNNKTKKVSTASQDCIAGDTKVLCAHTTHRLTELVPTGRNLISISLSLSSDIFPFMFSILFIICVNFF